MGRTFKKLPLSVILCYNFFMKRIILTAIIAILTAGYVNAGALTEDYIDIASSFAKEGKYSQALNYINKALAIEPQNARIVEMKNDLLKITGQGNSVTNLTNNNATYLDAENARIERDYSKAVVFYKKGIKENPDFLPNYLGLAITCYEMKNFQEAKNNLDTYLNKEPKSDFAYMLRAKTNMNLGETQSALRDIKSADSLFSNAEYKLTEAVILTELGKYEQARDILTKLSEKIQTYIVFKYLGICDLKLGDYKNAVLNFDRAIILFEDDKTILPMYNEAKRKNNES